MTKFKETEPKVGSVIGGEASKINRICDALRDELQKVNKDNFYLLPILTTYIKKQPQELKQVLNKIQEMQRVEKE